MRNASRTAPRDSESGALVKAPSTASTDQRRLIVPTMSSLARPRSRGSSALKLGSASSESSKCAPAPRRPHAGPPRRQTAPGSTRADGGTVHALARARPAPRRNSAALDARAALLLQLEDVDPAGAGREGEARRHAGTGKRSAPTPPARSACACRAAPLRADVRREGAHLIDDLLAPGATSRSALSSGPISAA